jgi:YbgC/YbaW family acyl-CoA thioester hydrolase
VSAPFVHELRVRYGECDPQGIVFNANYVAYFDVAFTELCREGFGSWQEMVERGIDAVLGEVNVRFRAPARFDDVLRLEARIARLGTTSTTTEIDMVATARCWSRGGSATSSSAPRAGRRPRSRTGCARGSRSSHHPTLAEADGYLLGASCPAVALQQQSRTLPAVELTE